jgi:hypothetical protein
MERLSFSLSHPQLDLAASPRVHSLAGLERKELSDLQFFLNELVRNMVQNPFQHQGDNQSTPLDGTRFGLLDLRTDHSQCLATPSHPQSSNNFP